MNRIRTIATSGIVAGSVALAAALISSGGVGASFVDAAEAGASITVADELVGLQPLAVSSSPACTVASDTEGATFSTAGPGHQQALDVTSLDADGDHSVTITIAITNPNTVPIDATWGVTSDGELTTSDPESGSATVPAYEGAKDGSQPVTITVGWPEPVDGAAGGGSATISVTCTAHADASSDPVTQQGPEQPGDSPAPESVTYTLPLDVDIPAAGIPQAEPVEPDAVTCDTAELESDQTDCPTADQ